MRRQPRVTAACSYRERHASYRIAFVTSSAHVISSEARNLPSSRVPMRFLLTSFVEMTRIGVSAGRVTGIASFCVSRYNNTRRQPRVTAACSYRERHASCRIAFITSSAHVISSEARNLPSNLVPMRFLLTSFVEMTRIGVSAGRVRDLPPTARVNMAIAGAWLCFYRCNLNW